MTHSKQIKMLDDLVLKDPNKLKLVVYDYWKNEMDENPENPHYCNELYPMTLRYSYKAYIVFKDIPTYTNKYVNNIYKRLSISDLVAMWKDETTYIAQRFKSSADFRNMYSLLANDETYCIEKNIEDSEKEFIKNYMTHHSEFKTYDEAVKAFEKKNHEKFLATTRYIKSHYDPVLRQYSLK